MKSNRFIFNNKLNFKFKLIATCCDDKDHNNVRFYLVSLNDYLNQQNLEHTTKAAIKHDECLLNTFILTQYNIDYYCSLAGFFVSNNVKDFEQNICIWLPIEDCSYPLEASNLEMYLEILS